MEVTRAAVTGAARGIGKAYVDHLLRNNVKVTYCDMDKVEGEKTLAELQQKYGIENVHFRQCDVSDMKAVEDFFTEAMKLMGGLDLLINNAGLFLGEDSEWNGMVDVNLKGTLKGMEMALKLMGKDRGGSGGVVVSTGSAAAVRPRGMCPQYSATKAAVVHATRCYADEYYSESGVKFMCINPSATNTKLLMEMYRNAPPKIMASLDELFKKAVPQEPDLVGRALIEVLQKGRNGSIWMFNKDGLRQLD